MSPSKRTGLYRLACGHDLRAALDTQSRVHCPKCKADTYVVRIVQGRKR